ncbi:hypothetical protein ACFLVQ_00590 [Chloroflexota bacterium]
MEVKLCLEEMVPGLPGGEVRVWAEALAEEVGGLVDWEVRVPEPVPVEVVFALTAGQVCLIR